LQLSNEIITALPNAIAATGNHLFWSNKPEESLAKSMNEFGQTNPVLVQKTSGGLELIAGHARLAVLLDSDKPVLARLVLDADERDKGLLYLTDNESRVLDDGMRLAALLYFSSFMDTKVLKSDILPRLGIKPKSKDAKLLMGWLTMPKNWQNHLAAGSIPLAAGPTLARMSEEDRTAVEPLFAGFSWSRSNAINMLNWLFETSKMTTSPIKNLMQSAGLDGILKQGLSPKDTIAKLNTAAKAARYPELSILQDSFARAASELTAGTKWRMNQPNNFETGGTELSIQIKDAAQLQTAIKDLEVMAGLSPWQNIWKLGKQND